MKTMPLTEAYKHLEKCSAVIWNDNFLCYPSLSQLTDEPDNEFLYLKTTDDEGLEYSVKFSQKENEQVKIEGSSLFLIDNEGDEIQVSLLMPAFL